MTAVSPMLLSLLTTNADINYYTQQQIYWAGMYEANSAKLEQQVNYEEKWYKAYESAIDNDKELHAGNVTVHANNNNTTLADKYAHAKVQKYNEELSLELAELDIEYDTMKTMYESLLEQMRAQKEGEKTATSTAAQDTGLLQS